MNRNKGLKESGKAYIDVMAKRMRWRKSQTKCMQPQQHVQKVL